MNKLGLGMLQAFVPQLLKMVESPKVKAKIVALMTAKKNEYFDKYELDREDVNLDVQYMILCSGDDIMVKVVLYDRGAHVVLMNLDFYRLEELVGFVKNLL